MSGAYVGDSGIEERRYYDFNKNQFGASFSLTTPYLNFSADTDGQRSLDVFGQSIRIKAAKVGQDLIQVQVYSRPLDNSISRATGWPRHMFILYDNGTRLWELERTKDGSINFPKRKNEQVEQYLKKWRGKLKGPLTVTVDRARFEQAMAAQETRQGQRYDAFNRNSNYAVRWVINRSITYGNRDVLPDGLGFGGGLGYAPGFGDPNK